MINTHTWSTSNMVNESLCACLTSLPYVMCSVLMNVSFVQIKQSCFFRRLGSNYSNSYGWLFTMSLWIFKLQSLDGGTETSPFFYFWWKLTQVLWVQNHDRILFFGWSIPLSVQKPFGATVCSEYIVSHSKKHFTSKHFSSSTDSCKTAIQFLTHPSILQSLYWVYGFLVPINCSITIWHLHNNNNKARSSAKAWSTCTPT